jgi:hypothetical protein
VRQGQGSASFLKKEAKNFYPLERGPTPVAPSERRRHSNVWMPAALEVALDASASCEAPGKSFLVFFSKKNILPSLPFN